MTSGTGFRISLVRQWMHILRQSSGAFERISYILRVPEVDSRPGAVRTQKSGHYFNKQLL